MNKSVLFAVSMSLLASSVASAGPLSNVRAGVLAAPRLAPIAATMPRFAAMPAMKSGPALGAMDLPPICTVNEVCIYLPSLGGLTSPAPGKEGWLNYNVNVYPGKLQSWAAVTRRSGLQGTVQLVNDFDHCWGYEGCSPTDPNDLGLFAESTISMLPSFGDRALGLVKGGGPVPLPKMPSPLRLGPFR